MIVNCNLAPTGTVCRRRSLLRWRPGLIAAAVGGLISLLAYGIIIYAMASAPLGAVSALRETSVLFAAALG